MRPAVNLVASPPEAHVRAQVERMMASDVFSGSPQLSAFLLFIVEAVLRGEGERLKGYTIGTEVLRRDQNFDPQIDPIVRVEATRLRRAIERYYAGPGANDPIVIELPRGGYMPRISDRSHHCAKRAAPGPIPRLMPGNGMPTLRVAPFVVVGTPQTHVIAAETLSSKIAEAFALFELVNVMAAAPPAVRSGQPAASTPTGSAPRSDYRLDGTLEHRGNGTVDLRFKLIDEADATVVWSRTFEKLSCPEDESTLEHTIILELATAIVQPFGVIAANDGAKRLASDILDPRYRCLLDARDALRSFDRDEHVRVRDRLEQLTEADPNFAIGCSLLAAFYGREYLTGSVGEDGTPPLDRALRYARRGIELRPESARGYHVLFIILFYRGEKEAGTAAAEKAIALNPYDVLIVSDFGGRLIGAGEVDRGMEILRQAVGSGAILPSWSHFYLFLGHYVRGEIAEARFHASQLTSETYVYGQLARALIAHRDGDEAEARRAVNTILSLQPAWRDHLGREIRKLITAPDVANRLARDFEATGYLMRA